MGFARVGDGRGQSLPPSRRREKHSPERPTAPYAAAGAADAVNEQPHLSDPERGRGDPRMAGPI
jgi:hypothetical protein